MGEEKIMGIFDLTIAWWNTGLTPIRGKEKLNVESIHEVILALCSKSDLLVLGEYRDFYELKEVLPKSFKMVDYYNVEGRCEFKTVLVFNTQKLTFQEPDPRFWAKTFSSKVGRYRVAQKACFTLTETSDTLDCYIIHWSQNREDISRKISAAEALKHKLESSELIHSDHQIILGDFNIEPYAEPLVTLGASRSRYFVSQFGDFWNPFWEFLSSNGTIRGTNKDTIRCFNPVFDQILLSKSIMDLNVQVKADIWREYEPPTNEHFPVWVQIKEI